MKHTEYVAEEIFLTGGGGTQMEGGWKLDLCLSADQKHVLIFMQILLWWVSKNEFVYNTSSAL